MTPIPTSTLSFALAVAALFIVVLAIATRPWWLAGANRVRRRRANVAAYQTRLAELDNEFTAGLIQGDDSEALKQELAARVLSDTDAAEVLPAPVPRPRVWVIAIAALLLAAFAGGGYWLDGSWRMQQQIASRNLTDPKIAGLIQSLADKLSQHPEDAEGWSLLGRSYFALQRFDDAAKAYGEANAHAKAPNAEWLTDEGEALAFADEQNLVDRSAKLFDRALQLQPDLGKALWYGGLAAAQGNDIARARMLWTQLAQQDLPAPMRAVLQERMTALDGAMPAADSSEISDSSASSSAVASAGAATDSSSTASTVSATAGNSAVTLHLRIALAPALSNKVPAGATLLVFAKADGGPPMPLAVLRVPGATLPLEVVLDDSLAMMPAMKLSRFDRYLVTARLSKAGMAQAASGDLQGSLKVSRGEAGQLQQLTIDSIVP
jgi:cytochrome c-type biogenesis protein CcmH